MNDLAGASALVHARITGFVGLVMLVSGTFTGVVQSRLVVRGDVAATAENIVASAPLFRLGLVGSLVMMIAFLIYALFLYRLLRLVNDSLAKMMIGFVFVSAPIYMLNQFNQLAVLLFASDRMYPQVKVFLEMHRLGNLIAGIFFGLWLFPLGLLVFRSDFIPRPLGVLLMLGSPGYLVLFVQAFLLPGSERTLWTNPFLVVTHVSELAMLWLLIRSVDTERWTKRALQAART